MLDYISNTVRKLLSYYRRSTGGVKAVCSLSGSKYFASIDDRWFGPCCYRNLTFVVLSRKYSQEIRWKVEDMFATAGTNHKLITP